MQGGKYTDNDQYIYRSYKCKVQCEPDPQYMLNSTSILKQLQEFKIKFESLQDQLTNIEQRGVKKIEALVPRVEALEDTCTLVFS